ncbi:MAG: site-specific integrase [Thaumarchaeota archaeon]|nr:site-specific integrase [Nitrososphaerota archaeon]
MQALEVEPLTEFFEAIHSPITKDRYEKRLDLFFRTIETKGPDLRTRARNFATRAKADNQWATLVINDYMRKQKERAERKEISESTVPNFFKPIKLFCEMNDIILNWKKISRRIPRGRSYGQDRIPTVEEIKQILGYPDRRIKPSALLMLSSGMRLGAFDYLRWKDIEKIEKNGQLVAAKIRVYAGTPDEYYSFLTPEAYNALDEYTQFRKSHGERMSGDSPVLRDLFHPDKLGKGEPHLPKRLKSTGVKRMIEDALKGTGIRKPLEKGKKRHEFQADHGFRKFFKSVCERHMKSLHVEILLGHDTGLNENYYRPSEGELLKDYAKALPDLTILEKVGLQKTEDVEDLKARVKVLEEAMREALPLLREVKKLRKEELENLRRKRGSKIG